MKRMKNWQYCYRPHKHCRFAFFTITTQLAEACGSRTQKLNSQLTANDDLAASAKFQLESIGVRTVDLPSNLGLLVLNVDPFHGSRYSVISFRLRWQTNS